MTPLSRRRFITISAALGASGLLRGVAHATADRVYWSGFAMGAPASLSIIGMQRAEAERLIAEVQTEIGRLDAIFSLYRKDSAIVRLNRDGALDAPPLDFVALLSTVNAIHEATGAAFDPTVQPLWRLLAESQGAPTASALAAARGLVGWPNVRVTSRQISFARPGMAITLNGIAQGYATDRVATLLRSAGLENVLISVGEIAALGAGEHGQPWQIGIADREDGAAEEWVTLRNAAIATTAPLGTVLDPDGRVGHIIEPRAHRPGASWRRISVINDSATIADGLSTGFVLMKEEEITKALSAFSGSRVVAVDSEGNRLDLSV